MPAPSIDAYLARIGYSGSRRPTLETLRTLHERHLRSVPFENLDIHWKRPIAMDIDRFLHKIIDQRRGGFCYELNGAFAWLLRRLGFDVHFLSARVPNATGDLGPPFDHMALLVTIGGKRWLADVGFGDSFLLPLGFEEESAEEFRIVGHEVRRNGKLEYVFDLAPRELHEFAPMCQYQQSSPESHFTRKRVCTMATEWGRVTLSDAKLIVTRRGVREETPVGPEQWDRVLRETFGIVRPGAVRG